MGEALSVGLFIKKAQKCKKYLSNSETSEFKRVKAQGVLGRILEDKV